MRTDIWRNCLRLFWSAWHHVREEVTIKIMRLIAATALVCMSGSASAQGTGSSAFEAQTPRDLFVSCAAVGDLQCVNDLLAQGVDPNAENSADRSALLAAVSTGMHDAIELLISAGADPMRGAAGGSSIEHAISLQDPHAVRLLLEGKHELAERLLFAGALSDDGFLVRSILDLDIDANVTDDDGMTPLQIAVMSGGLESAEILIAHGADLRARGAHAEPLALAVAAGNLEMTELLVSAGATPDTMANGMPVLTLAAVSGNAIMVELLLELGANRELRDTNGVSPAVAAASAGQRAIALRLGGVRNAVTGAHIADQVEGGSIKQVAYALAQGADPDDRDDDDVPALLLAASAGRLDMVDLLITHGADIGAQDASGNSALDAALAVPDPARRVAITDAVLIAANASGSIEDLLRSEDRSKSNALVEFALRYGNGLAAVDSADSEAIKVFRDPVFLPLFQEPDPEGVTPHLAALLAQNYFLLAILRDVGASPEPVQGQPLQELARARGHWIALYYLPDDRSIPEDLRKGASQEVKGDMQQLLKDWGYYTGGIDGVLGAGSQAAMTEFLRDRADELVAMSAAASGAGEVEGVAYVRNERPDDERVVLSLTFERESNCVWRVVEWDAPSDTASTRFVGCVRPAGDVWNANGIALVEYKDGTSQVVLFGERGWDDFEPLR